MIQPPEYAPQCGIVDEGEQQAKARGGTKHLQLRHLPEDLEAWSWQWRQRAI
jgi:hypothetical protein